jgi:hypothetical protein
MLDSNIRGSLDQIIDQMVSSLPITLSWLREAGLKANLHIDNEKDYALGYAHGVIKASFLSTFFMRNKRQPEAEETIEADTIIYKRTAELRDSINFQ